SLEIEELDELEEIEELEEFEDEVDDATPPSPPSRGASPPARTSPPARSPRPPREGQPGVPDGSTAAGHLPLPALQESLVPTLKGQRGPWSLLAERYLASGELMDDTRVEAIRATARLWEYGAEEPAKAVQILEEAVVRFELREVLVADLDAVFERHGGDDERASAYERVLEELTSPAASLQLRRTLAQMYERTENTEKALEHYENICSLDANDTDSIQAYITLLERTGDTKTSLIWQTTRLQASKDATPTDDYVDQAIVLAKRYADELEDTDECISRLVKLIREFPEHPRAPTTLAQVRFQREEWPKGIDVLKTALENIDEEAFTKSANILMAGVYEDHLNLPARAIQCWEKARVIDASDLSFLEPLKRLYIAVGRAEDALALIDDELQAVSDDVMRLDLLRTKADALYGNADQAEAWADTATQVLALDTEDDATRLRLVSLWISQRQLDEAEEEMKRRLGTLEEGSAAHLTIGLRLVDFYAQQRRDKSAAYELLATLERLDTKADDNVSLQRSRTGIARAFDDLDVLVTSLAATDDAESWLEAGTISLHRTKDFATARELLERVVEHEISQETDGPARLLSASEAM
ncbi:MAG: tetratricopeptide repeat protein, partial [Nannocystaceae bacterium]